MIVHNMISIRDRHSEVAWWGTSQYPDEGVHLRRMGAFKVQRWMEQLSNLYVDQGWTHHKYVMVF